MYSLNVYNSFLKYVKALMRAMLGQIIWDRDNIWLLMNVYLDGLILIY
jgi:hypothetical protein